MKSIYLAGPDVFARDARALAENKKRICVAHGFEGLFPLDNEIDAGLDQASQRRAIFAANIDMIRRSDLVLANVTPFKGLECDAGTAFEVGFAYALGIRTYLYSGFDQSIQRRHERLQHALEAVEAVAPFFDFARFEAEDLGAGVNLMLLEAAEETGGVFVASHAEAADDLEVFRMAVARLARDLG